MKHALILLIWTALGTATAFCQDSQPRSTRIDGFHEFNYGQVEEGVEQWTQAIRVLEPELRSEALGDVTVRFRASGMTGATAVCWQQTNLPNRWGTDVNLTPDGITPDAAGNGSFVFPAERFPHGPVNVRIYAHNGKDRKEIFELQLFNLGGVVWNQGIPDRDPPAAKGLQLIYADDFDAPLSISNDGRGATYMAHKPGGGDFSGWRFSNVLGDGKPFGQKETWLRIAARKDDESPKGRTGILASVNGDFQGVWAKAPCYLECRLTAQSAIGTWPAFWTLALGDEGTLCWSREVHMNGCQRHSRRTNLQSTSENQDRGPMKPRIEPLIIDNLVLAPGTGPPARSVSATRDGTLFIHAARFSETIGR